MVVKKIADIHFYTHSGKEQKLLSLKLIKKLLKYLSKLTRKRYINVLHSVFNVQNGVTIEFFNFFFSDPSMFSLVTFKTIKKVIKNTSVVPEIKVRE